jgi:hypothetical protein
MRARFKMEEEEEEDGAWALCGGMSLRRRRCSKQKQ